jgi:hypothetical protein
VALLEKRGFLYNHSRDFPQVILIVPSHVPNTGLRKRFSVHIVKNPTDSSLSTRVTDPDQDSIGSVDPDLESGSGSKRAKMTHKSRKKFESSCIEVLDGLC